MHKFETFPGQENTSRSIEIWQGMTIGHISQKLGLKSSKWLEESMRAYPAGIRTYKENSSDSFEQYWWEPRIGDKYWKKKQGNTEQLYRMREGKIIFTVIPWEILKQTESTKQKEGFLNPEEQRKLEEIKEFISENLHRLNVSSSIKPDERSALTHLLSSLMVRGITVAELKKLTPEKIGKDKLFYVPKHNKIFDSEINIDDKWLIDTNIISASGLFRHFDIRYREGWNLADKDEDFIQKNVAGFLNTILAEYLAKTETH